MKNLKIWSLAVVLLMALVGCDKNPDDGGKKPQPSAGFDGIEKEWKLVSVNDAPADFNVYIQFESGMFAMYQQVYSIDYKFYEGEYEINGNTLSGSYFDEGDWRCDYTGGTSSDGKSLILTSVEENPVKCVYEECTIPQEVKDEALTRAVEVTPFL